MPLPTQQKREQQGKRADDSDCSSVGDSEDGFESHSLLADSGELSPPSSPIHSPGPGAETAKSLARKRERVQNSPTAA